MTDVISLMSGIYNGIGKFHSHTVSNILAQTATCDPRVDPKCITREVFRGISLFSPLWFVFYLLFVIEIIFFLFGIFTLLRKYMKGKKDPIKRIELPKTLINAIKYFFVWSSHDKIDKTDKKITWAHRLMLLGFFVLFLGTVYITINNDIYIELLHNPKPGTFYGLFYEVFSFLMDFFGLIAILAIFYLIYRRYGHPKRLDYTRADKRELNPARKRWPIDDAFFIWYVLSTLILGFLLEGVRIVLVDFPFYEVFSSPVGYSLAVVLHLFGLQVNNQFTLDLYSTLWWIHFFQSIFFFTLVLPYTKGMHMLTAYLSLVTVDPLRAKRLPQKSPETEDYGYKTIQDFSWRELISLDACTKCGRCHISCPAQIVGEPLSPRDLILDLREQAAVTMGFPEYSFRTETRKERKIDQLLVSAEKNAPILKDTIWSCTTCMACTQTCPVAIEHVPIIIQLRRGLIEEGDLDSGIQSILEKVGRYGNSFGVSNKQRAKWTKSLDFEIKDAKKEEVEYLWYVGDFASFDQRAYTDSILVAKILHHVGIDFGLLFEKEKTAGNDIRRIGEEGLFESLVEDNLGVLKNCKFSKIITTDPHSLNTLRNEYTNFDPDFIAKPYHTSVIHYTTLLWDLIQSGKIQIKKKFSGPVTYHDPCYLGRYSGEYDAPRNIIKSLGFELKDMPRCRENSFCCGAGGGMIWKAEVPHGDRPALNRMREAESIHVEKFLVSCPKDKVMFTDASKDFKIEVFDIIHFLYEAMDIPAPAPAPVSDTNPAPAD